MGILKGIWWEGWIEGYERRVVTEAERGHYEVEEEGKEEGSTHGERSRAFLGQVSMASPDHRKCTSLET